MSKFAKPVLETKVPKCIDYHEAIQFIEQKHGIQTRDYARRHDNNYKAPYLDFWHWLLRNGVDEERVKGHHSILLDELIESADVKENVWQGENWVVKILNILKEEFQEDIDEEGYLNIWIDW
jgi:hypothetical protein